jgi:outer membrane lipoprotein-sorting protein
MNTLILLAAIGAAYAGPTIDDYLQRDVRDATFVAHVVNGSQRELRKINEDFGQSYKFPTTMVRFKDPFKLRLDATVEDTTATYVLNGSMQLIRVPRVYKGRHNLAHAPGRIQTALDFGLLVPSLFTSFFTATFVRMDRATGDPVFDISYDRRLDTSRNRIWVDPEHHIVVKREWYNQSGRQLATFFYENPKQVDGVWFPTQLTVRNMDDQVAGVTRYDSIKVNTGLSDDTFSTDE